MVWESRKKKALDVRTPDRLGGAPQPHGEPPRSRAKNKQRVGKTP
jgi:hypothetical protein